MFGLPALHDFRNTEYVAGVQMLWHIYCTMERVPANTFPVWNTSNQIVLWGMIRVNVGMLVTCGYIPSPRIAAELRYCYISSLNKRVPPSREQLLSRRSNPVMSKTPSVQNNVMFSSIVNNVRTCALKQHVLKDNMGSKHFDISDCKK